MVLASFLSAGYSLENSLSLSVKELEGLYGKTGMITEGVFLYGSRVRMNRPVELLLADMGRRSGIQDVDQFAQVFAAAKRSGGELTDIISQTAGIIRDKIQVQEEIHTLTAARVFEQKIMNGIPFGIILYIDFTSPGFFHVMYETWLGRIFMTACLGIYVGAVFLAKKILDTHYKADECMKETKRKFYKKICKWKKQILCVGAGIFLGIAAWLAQGHGSCNRSRKWYPKTGYR